MGWRGGGVRWRGDGLERDESGIILYREVYFKS